MDGHTYTANFEAQNGKLILEVYPDPLTGKEPWTVGLGHTGPDVKKGFIWSTAQCWAAFFNDYGIARTAASQVIGTSCWASLNEPRQAVLIDLAFNIGQSRLSGFHNMLTAIRAGDWHKAHDELLDSVYAKQVKTRATTNANILLTGQWPESVMVA